MKTNFPTHLSDRALVAEVMRLAGCERQATVHLITHLAELDKRKLYRAAGYSSLFTYCTGVLRLSEHEAFNRMKAARVVRRFPQILGLLVEGSLNLTTVKLIAAHLTVENHQRLLEAAAGKSKREVQELLARLFPQADTPPSVRKLPACRPTVEVVIPAALSQLNARVGSAPSTTTPVILERPVTAPLPPVPSRHHPVVAPLAPDRYQITVTVSATTREKVELAQDMLRHAIPNGDLPTIIDRALSALLEELARKKFAATNKPRASRGSAKRSRYIPAKVKRAVWIRDMGRCAFVAASGRRCGERAFVEFHHHDEPYGVGGPATTANLQLRCASHNAYEADLYYGPRSPEGVVRETAAPYEASHPRSTRSGTSCQAEAGARSQRRQHDHDLDARSEPWRPRLRTRLGAPT